MTAATATAGTPLLRPLIELYRDDGPLGRLLGATLGRREISAVPLFLAAAVPLAALLVATWDDPPRALLGAAIGWAVLLGGISSGCSHAGRMAWSVPTGLRALEYATLIWLAAVSSEHAMPAAFALLAAVAFRHYDIVYRLRHQRVPPPAWINAIGGGWEGRLLVVYAMLVLGLLPWALYVAAGVLGVVSVAESAGSWMRQTARGMQQSDEDDDEDETP